MERPEFIRRPEYEKVIQQVKDKLVKWEVGNKLHINVVNYAGKKEAYIEQMEQYCDENHLRFSEEVYHGEVREFRVTVHYSGSKTYTVKATSEEEAENDAEDMFGNDSNWEDEISDIEVE